MIENIKIWDDIYGSGQSLAILDLARKTQKFIIVITKDSKTQAQILNELNFFADANKSISVLNLPDLEILPYDHFSPHRDIISARLTTLTQLLKLKTGILLTSANSAMHRLSPVSFTTTHTLLLQKGENINLTNFRNNLINNGYIMVNQVFEHGEFSVRGAIFDIFPMGSDHPYRIDFFGDEIDSIRSFDPETQRSIAEFDTITCLPAHEFPLDNDSILRFQQNWQTKFRSGSEDNYIYQNISQGMSAQGIEFYLPLFFETQTIFDYLPQNTIVIKIDDIENAANEFWQEINERYDQYGHNTSHPILSPQDVFLSPLVLDNYQLQYPQIIISSAAPKAAKIIPDLTIDYHLQNPAEKLIKFIEIIKTPILFCAESEGRSEALIKVLNNIQIKPNKFTNWQKSIEAKNQISITVGQIERGLYQDYVIMIPESLLYGTQVMQRRRRKETMVDVADVIQDLVELHIGDPVVHVDYGIGRYLGLQTISANDSTSDYLTIEFAAEAKIYVPVTSLHLVSRYLGNIDNLVYTKLGTAQWEKNKRKAIEQIHDVAAELLEIYAKRAVSQGHAFKFSQSEYQKFASSFPFELTIDQEKAIKDVLNDMQKTNVMDRLICGDVGFGKTEVAMRAAFIAVQNNAQIAILVPTTILAQQHYQTLQDRFAGWPINIALLSRFVSAKQQTLIKHELNEGKIDLIVGTHKLIQKEIKFKNLGLLIIDEEHRFGVKQKEKFKSLRSNIDILTLTATPIPRTLNMSLSGIRDLSIITTPPAKRLAIKTFVYEFKEFLIREAILREILRGGQVYFVHNDIDSITKIAEQITTLVPEAKIAIAHGQMKEHELEQIMRDFYHFRFNILLCTTIIESGIDIPTANTIIINHADRFGLAQLHQLRGRVGRSHHQAYAYLFVSSLKNITRDARKRLDVIAKTDELGIGFTLATYDLEIRGAGEILGEEQSGQIQAIGFNLYLDFLNRAVEALKTGQKLDFTEFPEIIEVEIPIPALIPDDYINDVYTRLTFYKRIASAANDTNLQDLQVELIDRFGSLPEPTKNLFAITTLKLKAKSLGIKKIKASNEKGFIEFLEKPNINEQSVIELVQKQSRTYKLSGPHKLKFNFVNQTAKGQLQQLENLLEKLSKS